jgi:hypothetical protein
VGVAVCVSDIAYPNIARIRSPSTEPDAVSPLFCRISTRVQGLLLSLANLMALFASNVPCSTVAVGECAAH